MTASRPVVAGLVVLLLVVLRVASAFAAPDASVPDAAAPDARVEVDAGEAQRDTSLEEAVRSAREELAALAAFADGKLGPLRSTELFRVDLRRDDAVARRVADVKKELEAARVAARAAKPPDDVAPVDIDSDAGPIDDAGAPTDDWLRSAPASADVLILLRPRLLELRLQLLSLPRERREALLVAEQEALRAEVTRLERERVEREAALAEAAKRKALEAAQAARSNVERQLAEARANIEEVRAEQLRMRADLTERRRQAEEEEAERSETATRASDAVVHAAPGSSETDALYDRVIEQLVDLRTRGMALLSEIGEERRAPAPRRALDLPGVADPDLGRERDALVESATALAKEAASLESDVKTLVWSSLRSVMQTEHRLDALRVTLLERVSPAKRERVLGFGAEGRAQFIREVARIELELRWLRAAGDEIARETFAELRRPAAIVQISFQVVALIVLVWAALFVRRRHPVWLRLLRNTAARTIRRPSVLRTLQKATDAIEAVGGELVALVAVVLMPTVVRLDVDDAPWSVVHALLLWYVVYRLALAVVHRTLAGFAAQDAGDALPLLSARILRSVRLVGRSAFFFAILLASSAAVVGRGYLHGLVVRAAWLMSFVVAAILVRRWRDDIADAYLRVQPTGALSRLVSRTRDRWAGFFVAIAAFGVLLAGAAGRAVRRFVLGFEQSRKALAYMFRRRLEKQVEHAPAIHPLLDDGALTFFTEQPVDDVELVIDRFPGIDELEARFGRWREGTRVGATIVVGRTGYGKTSWLHQAQARCASVPFTVVSLTSRATRPEDIATALAGSLDVPEAAGRDMDALAEALRTGERRVIAVDDAQLWFLRGVETLEGWRAFERLVMQTSDRVLWVVLFAHYAWEFLSWIANGDHVFRSVVHLAPWSEREIGALLERRNAASRLEIIYDDLLVDGLDAGDSDAHVLSTARDYNRLVWDYAEGSPRVALHVWGRSLVPDGPGRARVRLFMNPDNRILEALSESAEFVLASMVWHERLSVDEAAATLRLPPAVCEDAFSRLAEAGITEEADGMRRVTARWWPVVVRYLRRKHLIDT